MNKNDNAVDFSGLRVTPESIALVENDNIAMSVPKVEIEEIALKYGFLSKHPIVQAIFGIGFIYLSNFPLKHFISWLQYGGTIGDITVLLILGIPIGAWVLYDGIKRGYFLEIQNNNRTQKFRFKGKPSLNEIDEFLNKINQNFGYQVQHLC